MIPADKFLEEIENKPVLFHVYSYYDKLLDTFNQPRIEKEEPAFMFEALVSSIRKGQFDKVQAKDLALVYLGTFDLKTGTFDIFKEPRIICDCVRYIAPLGDVEA